MTLFKHTSLGPDFRHMVILSKEQKPSQGVKRFVINKRIKRGLSNEQLSSKSAPKEWRTNLNKPSGQFVNKIKESIESLV